MKILIIGAGAIGCLVGGKLAQSGEQVTLVGRPRFVEAIRRDGLRLSVGIDTQCIRDLQAVASVAEGFQLAGKQETTYDLAILTVKSYDTETALAELETAVAVEHQPVPTILSLQNGVGNEEAIAARFGPVRAMAGTITAPVTVPEPGRIQVTKPHYMVGLAHWRGTPEALFRQVRTALQEAGLAVTVYDNAHSMKWTKLMMNMLGNATSAILDEPPQTIFADRRIADLEIDAWWEALAVMAAAGISPVNVEKYPLGTLAPLIRRTPKPLLRLVLRQILGGARGGKMPSLHIDLSKGRGHSEVNWLNGAVARWGKEVGVPTPVNGVLNETLLRLCHHPAEWAQWKGNHSKLLAAVAGAKQPQS